MRDDFSEEKMKLLGCSLISAAFGQAAKCGDFACIESMETVGCLDTCYEDGNCSGTQMYCCGQLALHDWDDLIKYQSVTRAAGEAMSIDHNILAAIISRESRTEIAIAHF